MSTLQELMQKWGYPPVRDLCAKALEDFPKTASSISYNSPPKPTMKPNPKVLKAVTTALLETDAEVSKLEKQVKAAEKKVEEVHTATNTRINQLHTQREKIEEEISAELKKFREQQAFTTSVRNDLSNAYARRELELAELKRLTSGAVIHLTPTHIIDFTNNRITKR